MNKSIIDKLKNLASKTYKIDQNLIEVSLYKDFYLNMKISLPDRDIFVCGEDLHEFENNYLKEFRQIDVDLTNAYIALNDFI